MSENAMIKKAIITIIAILILATIGFYFLKPYFIQTHLPKPVVIDTKNQPTLGNPAATIHLVIFEDLKCVNCARFNVKIFPYLKKRYIDTGIAKYTLMNLAFMQGSMPAANAAHCVFMQNNNLFFDYTDWIFHHQPPENENWATVPTLLTFASKIPGINLDQLGQCILKSPYDGIITANLNQAIKIMKPVATPTLYVNGVLVTPLTKPQIDRVIEAVK